MSKSASNVPHKALGKAKDALGDTRFVHQLSHEDVKGERKKRKSVDGGRHPLMHNQEDLTVGSEKSRGNDPQSKGDGHSQEEQQEETNEEEENQH